MVVHKKEKAKISELCNFGITYLERKFFYILQKNCETLAFYLSFFFQHIYLQTDFEKLSVNANIMKMQIFDKIRGH